MSPAKRRFSLAAGTAPTAEPGGLSAVPTAPAVVPDEPVAAALADAPAPAAEKKGPRFKVRIPLNADPEMRRALEEARLEDRIDTTTRIRAMIKLWQEDDRLRARVNKRAAQPDVRP
jgi:hypothetical protein